RWLPQAWSSWLLFLLSAGSALPVGPIQLAAAEKYRAGRHDPRHDDEPPIGQGGQLPGDDDFVRLSFNYDWAEIVTRERLTPLLKQKIAAIDRFCDLSDVQRQKLQLSGRGDIKRRLDAIERARSRFELVRNDAKRASELRH